MRKEGEKLKCILKTIGYKILSIITIISITLGLNTTLVKAEENQSYDYTYIKELNRGESNKTAIFQLKDDNGIIYNAYCVDKETVIKDGHNYAMVDVEYNDYYSEENAKHIRAIIKEAYPFQTLDYMKEKFNIPTLTEKEAIDAIQFAIWHYANAPQDDFVSSAHENIKNLFNQLINLPGVEESTAVAKIDFLEPIATFDGENYDVDFGYKVIGSNYDGSEVSSSYLFEDDLSQYGAGVEELGVDENGYTHVRVRSLPSSTSVNLKVNANQNRGQGVYVYTPEGGRNASQSLVGAHEVKENIVASKEFTTNVVSEVIIKKVDAKNNEKVLQGAEFTIISRDTGYTVTVTTDENGLAPIKLPLGQYTVVENKAPQGYVIIEEVRHISVTDNATEIPVFIFENEKIIGSLSLTKIDKDNKAVLEGAEFIIKDENGKEIARGKTDKTGVVKFKELPYGNYTYQEVTAPKGYILDSKEYSFAITTNNEELNITIENEKVKRIPTPSEPSNIITTTKAPNTGDTGIIGITSILLSSIAGFVINNRKKTTK
ncbi:MAG: Cys-Gln thioester bond-forming surface protein [Clostridium sp.]|nr:Cys-Gln thioester bond-forming surface protein [Clostridium sp.]